MELTHEARKALRETDWNLNVRDEFKGMNVGEVQTILSSRRNGFEILFENALRDFNFGGIVRASNGFCCSHIMYTGFRRYDPRGSVGTKHYEHINHVPRREDFIEYIKNGQKQGIPFIVAEYVNEDSEFFSKQQPLPDFKWSENCMVMFGEEGTGVAHDLMELSDNVVYVPMFGSVRSFNVASTAHMFMYDYMVKTGRM